MNKITGLGIPGAVIYALRQADEYVTHTPHGDNCYLTDEPSANIYRCGKESLSETLHEIRMQVDQKYLCEAVGLPLPGADGDGTAKGGA